MTPQVNSIRTFSDSRGEMKFIDFVSSITGIHVEQFISTNKKNVFRGIHISPYGKFITCLQGAIIDYCIDIVSTPIVVSKIELKENDRIYIPAGQGHAFIVLEDDTKILYQLEGRFDPLLERNVNCHDPFINLQLPSDIIVSQKDRDAPFLKPIDYLIIGSTGFLGKATVKSLVNKNWIALNLRLEETEKIKNKLELYKPKYVICCAGISGKPTISWCDTNQEITTYTNLTLQLSLAHLCYSLNIHLTIYGSGLVYDESGTFTELSPCSSESHYSFTRILLEAALVPYLSHVLYLRIIYPISADQNPKCFLSKMKERIQTVHNKSISITVIPSLFPLIPIIIEKGTVGIFNFVNTGSICLEELVRYYILKPNINTQITVLDLPHTSLILDSHKLQSIVDVEDVKTALNRYVDTI